MPPAPRTTPRATVALAAVVLAGTLAVGSTPIYSAPPMGPLLDPVRGVWALARTADAPVEAEATIPGMRSAVDVVYDDRGVPHVFASSITDASRAMGFVHARDRLFQMEIQTRAVAGTLAELVGNRALPLDREARSQGLAASALRTFEALPPDSPSRLVAAAYADGVNAYLAQMRATDVPFEFRLLNARPQPWRPEYMAYLFARMGLTLAFSDGELRRGAVEALVGRAATDALFPRDHPIQEPIQPNGQRAPRFDWRRIPPPAPGDTATRAALATVGDRIRYTAALAGIIPLDAGFAGASGDVEAALRHADDVAVGSNNWAVAPRRTAAGHALLAGDPHLSLTLPSIWYEAHLVVPDSLDVYGVTIPGAPIPPIWFNRDVATSATNTGADVADYYLETVDDTLRPRQYRVDGTWRPLRERVEVLRGKHGRVLATDTVLETHRGTMFKAGSQWISRRWTVTDGFDTMAPFLDAVRSRSVKENWAAMDRFLAPAQNWVTADRGGHIALRSTGTFPLRGGAARRGDILLDGASSANDWQGSWKVAEYPQAYDPAQGFVVSANQQPKDPRVDPRYLGWDWPSPWRAMRIAEMLRGDSGVTVDRMRRMQTDPVSVQTRHFLPAFLSAAAAGASADPTLARIAAFLREWDGTFAADALQPTLYEAALSELAARTWDELVTSSGSDRPRRVETPQSAILLALMQEPDNVWWDDGSTRDVRERRDDILRSSLVNAWSRVTARLGQPGDSWAWGRNRRANIRHLIGLPILSRPDVPVVGGPGSVSPSSGDGNHSASWRMVVELGDSVRAWGIYPGGQSGNPASARYDDFIGRWSAGTLDTLRFPRTAGELTDARRSGRLTLRGSP